jgi:3-oxoacyl-[acyl-carrier-protein] synthase-3
MQASEIDLIVVATSTPDFIFPSTACLLQSKLGAKGAPAFDVQAVCSGFVYGLTIADKFIRSGQYKSALVVGAEVFSRILDWNDRSTAVLFGDGAGAVVLKADTAPGIMASVLHADGSQSGILSVPGNICGGKVIGSPFLQMDGQAVFKFAVRVLEDVGRETLAQAGVDASDIDWLVPHQANLRILEATAKRFGLDRNKLIVTVDQHANTSAASVPLALDCAIRDGRIKPGHKLLLQGVGGGFTWGAALVQM